MLLCILDIDRLKKKKKKKLNTFLRFSEQEQRFPLNILSHPIITFILLGKKSELYSYALVKTPGRLFAKSFPYSMCSL